MVEQNLASILTCVMARPGIGPRTVFAKSQDGEVLHISRVAAGTQDLVCLDCGFDLIAKPGHGGRVPHFAHKSSGECQHAGETNVHLMAKEVIERAGGLMLPAFEVRTGARMRWPLLPQWFDFERIELEKAEDGFRPDVVGYGRHPGTGEVHRLMIEVFVTNRVSEKKIDRIAAAGESAIEIDLSKIDRDLSGPDFIEQILQAAPRRWLHHRAQERLRQKAFLEEDLEEAEKERRKTFAIAMDVEREEERQRARQRPPGKAVEAELHWAAAERAQWTLLGMEGLFVRAADDGIFDVEPALWRAWVLSALAPWRKEPYQLPNPAGLGRFAAHLGKEMRKRKWVKAPFAGELKKFVNKRHRPWDPVAEEIKRLLVDGLGDLGFSGARQGEDVSLSSVGPVIKAAWQERRDWARGILVLRDEIAKHGVDVWLGGLKLQSDTEIDSMIAAHGVGGDFTPIWLPDLVHEIKTGIARFSARMGPKNYARERMKLQLPGDDKPGGTERALEHIRQAHMSSWRRELEDWTRGEVDRLLSVFQGLVDREILPLSEVRAQGGDFLLDQRALWSRIHKPLSDEARDPLAEARAAQTRIISSLETFAEQIEYLGELASLSEAPEWQDIILREGVRSALAADGKNGFRRAMSRDMRSTLHKSLTDLALAAGGWGYGLDFPQRALVSRPTWSEKRLVDLAFGGEIQPFRRAMNEIVTRQQPPKWVVASTGDAETSTPSK